MLRRVCAASPDGRNGSQPARLSHPSTSGSAGSGRTTLAPFVGFVRELCFRLSEARGLRAEDRHSQCRGAAAHAGGRSGAGRRGAGGRGDRRPRRAPHPACGAADRLGAHVRADARRRRRHCRVRGLGEGPGGRRGQGGGRRVPLRAQPPLRRRRADDRHDHGQPAGAGGREPRLRQPRLLRHQRGPRQGHALRRQRCRGAGAAAPGCATCWGRRWAARSARPAASRSKPIIARGLGHGRRDAPAQRRLLEPAAAPAGAGAGAHGEGHARRWRAASISSARTTSSSSTWRWPWARPSPIRRATSRARRVVTAMCRNGTDFGIRVSGTGRYLVHGAGRDAGRALFPGLQRQRTPIPTWATPPSSRRSASAASPWRRRRPWSASSARGRPRAPRSSPARWARSPSAAIRNGRSRRSTAPACRPASTSAWWWRRGSRRPSTRASPIASRASGQVGAGVVKAPMACFEQALVAFAERMGVA